MAIADQKDLERDSQTISNLSLSSALKRFIKHKNAWMISAMLLAAIIGRIYLAGYNYGDLSVFLFFVIAQPFSEWFTHILLLHARPYKIFTLKIDPSYAKAHRAHHMDPKDEKLIFIPTDTLLSMLIGAGIIYSLALPTWALTCTATIVSLSLLLVYEWTHFLIHSTYKPKTFIYRYIWRAHRLHHFRNENYWFGITGHFADHIFGTFPKKDEVPLSATCRTLGLSKS
jgi:hypothetical protein